MQLAMEHPVETIIQFTKVRTKCSLDEWYQRLYGYARNIDVMAPYTVTHEGNEVLNNLLYVEHEGQSYFCKICSGGKGVLNEYQAHDVLDPLNSPHIIKIEKRLIVGKEPEHCRGAFLAKICNQYERVVLRPFTKVIMRQLFEALSIIHANKIVHLDIKPENIVWERKDGQPHIYVIDFGLSYPVGTEHLYHYSTMEGSWLYMSPERLDLDGNDEPSDIRTVDVWSAGMVFAELLLGCFLFYDVSKEILEDFLKNKMDARFEKVDPLAYDLLKHLFAHHTKRYTADQALQHPYFQTA